MIRRALMLSLSLQLTLAAGSLHAQAYRYGAGWTVGGSYLTRLNPDAGIAQPVELDPGLGFLVGLHLERAYGSTGRVAVRYQGTYQRPEFAWAGGERAIDAASLDVAALFRLIDPTEISGVMPYLTLGVGGIWYDLGRGDDNGFPIADAYHDGSSRVLPMATFGLGADVDTPWTWDTSPVRIRLEVADHMTFGSPLRRVTDRERYGPVHHLRFTVGAYAAVELIR